MLRSTARGEKAQWAALVVRALSPTMPMKKATKPEVVRKSLMARVSDSPGSLTTR
jgi:hypothetical protein